MTKQLISIWALLSVLIFAGCEKQHACSAIAPATTVSWTEYNTPAALHSHFGCNAMAIKKHLGDTIRICGWAYYPDNSIREPIPDPIANGGWSANTNFIYLVSNEDHHGWNEIALVKWDPYWLEDHPQFCQSFEEYLDKEWYVVAALDCFGTGDECCPLSPVYRAIAIDTTKNRKQP